jgi:tripartite-type tricarboxylate transporter receptor subunit TctC
MTRFSRRSLAPLLALGLPAQAQPLLSAGSVRIIVPYNPGGITDILARALAQQLAGLLGNSVVVENRAGANGSIGATVAARAAADGATLLLGVTDTHAVNPAAMQNLSYDAVRDFAPISNITNVPLALAVGPSQRGVADLRGFVAAAKAKPDGLTHSSWGVGSVSQLAMLRIGAAAGIQLLHVPYTGAAPAAQALAAGQVDAMVLPAGAADALSRDGGVRVLAVLSPQRLALLPDVPTLQEQGVPLSTSIFQALFAPARTPAPVLAKLHAAVVQALAAPAMLDVLRAQAALPDPTTPEGLAALVVSEQEAWGKVVRSGNIRLD